MIKIQKHIEIVRSNTPRLSSLSQKSCDAIFSHLDKHYENVGVTIINNRHDLKKLTDKKPDLVFMGMKYVRGLDAISKIWISDFLEENEINHTGSTSKAVILEQDKVKAKQKILDNGLVTSKYIVLKKGHISNPNLENLKFPLFVKPTNLGAGVGIDEDSVVHNLQELKLKVSSISINYNTDSLVEEYLSGREFSVAVLRKKGSNELLSMPIEILPSADTKGNKMLSHRLKAGKLETPVSAVHNLKLKKQLQEFSINVFNALGARDYGRIDTRLDAKGVPHFLEANLIPCLIKDSGNFPKACSINFGIDYQQMINHIVHLGFSHDKIEDLLIQIFEIPVAS